MPEITYLEAIRLAMYEEMQRDPRVFVIGEDVGSYGGAFRVTQGFLEAFGPSRVIDTPISESAIVGASIGAALMGMRPVAEMQFIDFISCAFDMLVNYAAKSRYRWGGGVPMQPLGGVLGSRGECFQSNHLRQVGERNERTNVSVLAQASWERFALGSSYSFNPHDPRARRISRNRGTPAQFCLLCSWAAAVCGRY